MNPELPPYQPAIDHIRQIAADFQPQAGLILGSGWGPLAEQLEDRITIPYREIPGFPESTVKGHKGNMILGRYAGKDFVILQGRLHFYEGHPMPMMAWPIRLLAALGIRQLIITNAAGGINEQFEPGDLMLIRDHLNLAFGNPLIGPNQNQLGPRFPDTSGAYAPELQSIATETAASQNLKLHAGTYMFVTGPSYETPAEIVMARGLGADAVGMSTVPEVITAAHAGIPVLGISLISNKAAGLSSTHLSHDDVMEVMEQKIQTFIPLVLGILSKL